MLTGLAAPGKPFPICAPCAGHRPENRGSEAKPECI